MRRKKSREKHFSSHAYQLSIFKTDDFEFAQDGEVDTV